MKNLFLASLFLLLNACSTPEVPAMKLMALSPDGIVIMNIDKTERVEAYRLAEKHCAKYAKVPRLIETSKQLEETDVPLLRMNFACLRPSSR